MKLWPPPSKRRCAGWSSWQAHWRDPQEDRSMQLEPRDRLIVALDLSSVEAARAMVAKLGDAVSFYKIGYQLAYAGGLGYVATLIEAGKRVFLDLKLHDIGNT